MRQRAKHERAMYERELSMRGTAKHDKEGSESDKELR